MANEESNTAVILVRILMSVIVAFVLAAPLAALINNVFGPRVLDFIFGGYITYWKCFGLYYVCRFLFAN